jgi:hypothetical protein
VFAVCCVVTGVFLCLLCTWWCVVFGVFVGSVVFCVV